MLFSVKKLSRKKSSAVVVKAPSTSTEVHPAQKALSGEATPLIILNNKESVGKKLSAPMRKSSVPTRKSSAPTRKSSEPRRKFTDEAVISKETLDETRN